MRRERDKPEEFFGKLRQVDVLVSQGRTVADAVRAIGVTEVTYYRWRQEFGGLKSDQVKRLKDLEAENARLRRAVSDLTLDKMILRRIVSWRRGSERRRRDDSNMVDLVTDVKRMPVNGRASELRTEASRHGRFWPRGSECPS